ncbi:ABC transporter permease [Wenzhouxiangella sp. AB-CW3]|uniref:ABC transporter permease n=1 Tax=Wenzhouxiangella sp. AB-CW3 TaxID=2771012 RepID=UPI00168A4A7E|nr:ABC transporter permease [Wenzhouxiangella sp. AB-CW3]QOC21961.1 ABC transporter permease [Wenzhouxiangella sp. AB-CW3]
MNHSIIEVVRKELKDGLRDRRSMTGVVGYALLVPLLLAMMLNAAEQQQAEGPGEVKIVNKSAAPGLMAHLRAEGYELVDAQGEPGSDVRPERQRPALRVDPEFGARMEQGRPARVFLMVDSPRDESAADRLDETIGAYAAELAQLRLQSRGVSPELIRPVDIQRQDFSTPAQRAAQLLGILVFFLLMAPFAASMSLAIDMLAGERERRSMELLLVQPVAPWHLATGKWLTAALFGLAGTALILVASGLILPRVDVSSLGTILDLPLEQRLLLGVAIAPLAFLAAGLQSLLSLFARSYKEAQFYLSGLMFLPMMVLFGLDFLGIEEGNWQSLTPVVAQHELAMEVLRGTVPTTISFVAAAVPTLVLAILLTGLAAQMLKRERAVSA